MLRVPHYCSGCPHNTSTRVPEGSRALAGIGCHYMATWLYPATQTFSAMGGEGVAWVGQAPFTETKHVFANLGDGTYMHSGILAIRQALAAKVPITYKILYNDAVAMTGGQPIEGALTVPQIVRQVAAEGVERIEVVTDEPWKYTGTLKLPDGIPVRHRRELDAVQRNLRDYAGVSVLLYDQTCAAEKRRRRKRGTYPDPAKRVVINDRVCEGCGDCSATSNCMSVTPWSRPKIRPQARDRSVLVQQGFFLRRRLLPELRHRARRRPAQGQGLAAFRGTSVGPGGARATRARSSLMAFSSPASAAPES